MPRKVLANPLDRRQCELHFSSVLFLPRTQNPRLVMRKTSGNPRSVPGRCSSHLSVIANRGILGRHTARRCLRTHDDQLLLSPGWDPRTEKYLRRKVRNAEQIMEVS